jgi:ribosomal protein S18 acetylase RimI-like enzyme
VDNADDGVSRVIEARRAVPEDAPELVRLRRVMFIGIDGHGPEPGPWLANAEERLRKWLSDPDGAVTAFVVDWPDRPAALAACAVGAIDLRLASPDGPSGEVGYVFNVATDPDCRRRGYSRACMESLLGWFRQRGVRKVDLRASEAGEPLYRSLGFRRTKDPNMRLRLPR